MSKSQLQKIIDEVHLEIFGMSREKRAELKKLKPLEESPTGQATTRPHLLEKVSDDSCQFWEEYIYEARQRPLESQPVLSCEKHKELAPGTNQTFEV